MIRAPWGLARDLFTPLDRYGLGDVGVQRLARWRSAVGLATILATSWQWQGASSLLVAVYEAQERLLVGTVVALAIAPTARRVLWLATPPPGRARLLDHARPCGRGLGAAALALLIVIVMALTFVSLGGRSSMNVGKALLVLLMCLVFVYIYVFALFTSYYGCRYAFGIGSAHAMLTPLCSCALVFVVTVVELVESDTHGVPLGTWLVLTVGGLVSTCLLGGYEVLRLRRRGLRLLAGPVPT